MPWKNLGEDILEEFTEAQNWAPHDEQVETYALIDSKDKLGERTLDEFQNRDWGVTHSNERKLDDIHEARKSEAYRERERWQQNQARAKQMQDPALREYRRMREREAMRKFRAKAKSVTYSQHGKEEVDKGQEQD